MGHVFSAAHHSHSSDGCTRAEFCGDWVQGWRFSQAVYISTSLITSTPQTWRRLDLGPMIQTEESPLFLFYEVTYIYCFLQANMQMLIWISICQRIQRKERDRRKTCHSDWSLPGVHSSAVTRLHQGPWGDGSKQSDNSMSQSRKTQMPHNPVSSLQTGGSSQPHGAQEHLHKLSKCAHQQRFHDSPTPDCLRPGGEKKDQARKSICNSFHTRL